MKTPTSPFWAGLWHMLGVMSAVSYWFLSLLFLWGGMVLLGTEPVVGQITLAFVVGLFVIRLLVGRRLRPDVVNVLSCLGFALFALVANIYNQQQTSCGVATHADGRQERICL
ncbi:MAG: hypothetical protein QM645_10790 [Asticcacaulis sp.]